MKYRGFELEYYNLIEENKMSNLFSLDWRDLLNGLITAVLGSVVLYLLAIFSSLYQLVINGEPFKIAIDGQAVLVVAVFSALTYLAKRFVSGNSGVVLSNK